MTSARRFESKKRNSELRKQKPIILIVAEGENVTETQYFRSFQRRNADKNIRIILAKHVTDPEGMLKALQNKWKEMSLDSRKGDKAIEHSVKLREFFEEQNCRWPSVSCNPRTDVDLIVSKFVALGDGVPGSKQKGECGRGADE